MAGSNPVYDGGSSGLGALLLRSGLGDEEQSAYGMAGILCHHCLEDITLELSGRLREAKSHFHNRCLRGEVVVHGERVVSAYALLGVVRTELSPRPRSEVAHKSVGSVVACAGPLHLKEVRVPRSERLG